MRAIWIIPALLLADAAGAQGTTAPKTDWDNCTGQTPPKEKAAACTRLLDTGQQNQAYGALIYRGNARWKLRQYAGARADLTRAAAMPAGNRYDHGAIWLMLGYIEMEAGTVPAAITAFTKSIETDPARPEAFTERAQLLLSQGKATQALADADAAVSKGAKSAPAWKTRGRVKYTLGDKAGAYADVVRALELNPRDPDTLQLHAVMANEQGQYEAGAKSYDAWVALEPKNNVALNGACWSRTAYLRRDYDAARKMCDASIALKPEANSYDSRGLLGLRQARYQDAWDDYNMAARKDKKMASAVYGRGIAAIRLGKAAQGQADIAAAAKLDPQIASTFEGYGIVP